MIYFVDITFLFTLLILLIQHFEPFYFVQLCCPQALLQLILDFGS